jgi:hypothetical protein
MLRLYLFFMGDAVKVVAGAALALLALLGVLSTLDVPTTASVPMLTPLMAVGFMLLSRRYLAKNLGWILGLPYRKASLAWFNFGLNLSIFALVGVAYWLVAIVAGAGLSHSSTHAEVSRATGEGALPHGLALAALVFGATVVPVACWGLGVQPAAGERARRRGAAVMVLVWIAGGIVLVAAFNRQSGISPLFVFGAATALLCVFIARSTAMALKTSVRQRRTWMFVGASIALIETLGLLAVSVSDLHSPNASVREEAAALLGG